MIEDIYRSIGKSAGFWKTNLQLMVNVAYMFPETANWVTSASEYVPSDTLHLPVLIPPSKGSYTSASIARFDRGDLNQDRRMSGAWKRISGASAYGFRFAFEPCSRNIKPVLAMKLLTLSKASNHSERIKLRRSPILLKVSPAILLGVPKRMLLYIYINLAVSFLIFLSSISPPCHVYLCRYRF